MDSDEYPAGPGRELRRGEAPALGRGLPSGFGSVCWLVSAYDDGTINVKLLIFLLPAFLGLDFLGRLLWQAVHQARPADKRASRAARIESPTRRHA